MSGRASNALGRWAAEDGYARPAAVAVFVVVTALLWALIPAQGLTDDDDFYVPAGASYAEWLGQAVTDPGEAFSKAAVDRRFRINREHPPLAKYSIGVTQALTTRLGLFGDLDGGRAGVALLAALLCSVMLRLLWRPFGPGLALFAVAALLAMPRFLFHSQVATLDVPVAALVVLTTAAYFWGEQSRRWAWGTGVVFGLAMLTKLNAPFVAIACTAYALVGRWPGLGLVRRPGGRRSSSRGGGYAPVPAPVGQRVARAEGGAEQPALRLPAIPRQLVAMALIGPVVFFAGWPWLWFDSAKRFGEYLAFHLQHYPIYLFYEGEIYTKPFAPWHMPFTMAAGVIPLPLLVLGLIGVALAGAALFRVARRASPTGPVDVTERDRLLALILLQAALAISIVAFLNVPKYGGAKLFMPFFPLFAILAAAGLGEVGRGLATLFRGLRAPGGLGARARPAVLVGVASLALLPGVVGSVRFHGGFALSYYAEALGGLRGATARGYERTYYDIADKELARWLDENARGERVHFEPNHKEYVRTYRWLKRDGVISSVRLERRRKNADVLVLTHERRWKTYRSLLAEHRGYEKVHEKRIDGVPLWTVYRRR